MFQLSKKVFFSYPKNLIRLALLHSSAHRHSQMAGTTALPAKESLKIVWMDLEMTGLTVQKDKIIEISCLITDKELNVLSEGPTIAINYPKEVFESMNEWCMTHHYESGLVERCLQSNIPADKAESMLLEYLQQNVSKGVCPLAGNSVYMDRSFLREHMPSLDDYLHYRIIDVSTIKELCTRWNPRLAAAVPKKKLAHRSLDDILESIDELRYYRQHFFKTV